MSAAEKRHKNRVAALGCVVCRNLGLGETPAALHHIKEECGMSQRQSDFLVIPLCPQHHQHGGRGVAIHAGIDEFERMYGSELDLLAQTIGELA